MSEEIETEETPKTKSKKKSTRKAPTLTKIMKKLDSIEKRLESIEEGEVEEKEDADPRDALIEKAEGVLRTILEGALPKEKLDAMPISDLITAYELKGQIKTEEVGNPAPKSDSDKKDLSYAQKMLKVRLL